jgi:hypothetical protein
LIVLAMSFELLLVVPELQVPEPGFERIKGFKNPFVLQTSDPPSPLKKGVIDPFVLRTSPLKRETNLIPLGTGCLEILI